MQRKDEAHATGRPVRNDSKFFATLPLCALAIKFALPEKQQARDTGLLYAVSNSN
jgi:hypothetical protein